MTGLLLALALGCSTERGSVKTLHDRDAPSLSDPVTETTVEDLRELPAPPYSDSAPRSEAERTVYALTAEVTAVKLEADGDVHAVIRGASGGTMVAEVVDPECVPEAVRERLAAVRKVTLDMFKPTQRLRKLKKPVKVRIVGPLFWDKVHGQAGVAPNGVELHPLLSIEAAR